MKGSKVLLSLKSLADRLHPQLPLNTRESRKLLAALTSSFRKHLDEAHPSPNEDVHARRDSDSGAVLHTVCSSASYADNHLASVLTSPLLNGGEVPDIVTARKTLARNVDVDPLRLFEEYRLRKAASVQLMSLCIGKFWTQVASMPLSQRSKHIREHGPGGKMLLFLLHNDLHRSNDFLDDGRLMNLIVHFLLVEDRDQDAWKFLMMDFTLENSPKNLSPPADTPLLRQVLHKYRWRDRWLRAMIISKLGFIDNEGKTLSVRHLHGALDMFMQARDIKVTASSSSDLRYFNLAAAAMVLKAELTADMSRPRIGVDVNRYNMFIASIPSIPLRGLKGAFFASELELVHPRHSKADKAFRTLQELFGSEKSRPKLLVALQDSKSTFHIHSFRFITRTLFILEEEGRNVEAAWLRELTDRYFPDKAKDLDADLKRMAARAGQGVLAPIQTDELYPLSLPLAV